MIPKIIHYCWFGGKPLPELARKCIASWHKYCPDYEIKEWNESNFDINSCKYVKQAFDNKKWAFITDYVRLYALVNEGGIYMDTDVEVLASLNSFLCEKAFSGFETSDSVPTGIMACEKGFPLFVELLKYYDNVDFILPDGSLNMVTNVVTITNECEKRGLIRNNTFQIIDGFALYPKDYFCPKNYSDGKIYLTDNSVTIHHFSGSWMNTEDKISMKIYGFFGNKGILFKAIGVIIAFPFNLISRVKKIGLLNTLKFYLKWEFLHE